MRLTALFACLALACAAPAPPTGSAGPRLELDLRPDARVLAVGLQPADAGWSVAGRFSLPRPVLPSEAVVALEGLDDQGRSLWRRDVELDLVGAAPRRHVTGRFEERLPATEGLAVLRVSLPAGR